MEGFIVLKALFAIWSVSIIVGGVCWGLYKMWNATVAQYIIATWPHNDHDVYYTPRERLVALVCAGLLAAYLVLIFAMLIYFAVDFLKPLM